MTNHLDEKADKVSSARKRKKTIRVESSVNNHTNKEIAEGKEKLDHSDDDFDLSSNQSDAKKEIDEK